MEQLVNNCLKLGFGMMRLPKPDGKNIDIEESKKMVDAYIAAGGRYFDTAYVYEGSEAAVGEALVKRYPRESYYLATKLNAGANFSKNKEDALHQLEVSLERTGAGYFDFYLLHALGAGNIQRYDDFGVWDFVKELKKKGIIKHYGFSFHDTPEMLDKLLTEHPDVEFVQLQLNYADWEAPTVQSRGCYEVAEKHDKPVIVMEPLKGGLLAAPPTPVQDVFKQASPEAGAPSWGIRFVATRPNVMMVLSGMSTLEQVEDNLSFMKEFQPLTAEEEAVVAHARQVLDSIDKIACTSCRYCTPGCPMQINIPTIFACMNIYKMYGRLKEARHDYGWRPGKVKASACIGCGKCEQACPQHLPIRNYLKEVVEVLEK